MSSLEKLKILTELDNKGSIAKITTVRGEKFFCKLEDFAEDEEDLAYRVTTLDTPPRHFVLECDYIENIEEFKNSAQFEDSSAIPA